MDRCVENNIEFLVNQDVATCTFSSRKWINQAKRLANSYPEQCQIVSENLDGSVVMHIPVSCIKLRAPRVKKDDRSE